MNTPLIGVSQSILKIKELINHVANTCLNVLITGETGVGKEVVARSLFVESARSDQNFVKLNCAALPETLLESELYGYEKGAFTGAHKKRSGKFVAADKGVLFLDEIGDMPITLQSKILHVLQSGEFSPLGSDQDYHTDVWVIAATNRDLEECIADKTFRVDLFYRLNIIKIDIPPLRKRKEDIPALIEYYFRVYQSEFPEAKNCKPDPATLEKLCKYHWPGNVRQLQNCIKKRLVMNSWEKVFEEMPEEAKDLTSQGAGAAKDSELQTHSILDSTSYDAGIISEFVDLSTSS
ncbi:MAG: sigma-54-dependent Fis family transcriptional regulator, partial [Desulfobacteraceae bacterium]|nr:sigma-54-dependent Fis family transcriptional regulator [Desulfobacteraceae bacterium]